MQDRVLYKTCPLCDADAIVSHINGDASKHALYDSRLDPIIRWRGCRSCKHIFTEGYYTDEAIAILFSKTQDTQRVGANMEVNRVVSGRMIERVLPFVSEGVWLDVGFGNGALLFAAQEFGFTPIGIDLRRDNVDALNEAGVRAELTDIFDLELDEKCAVISMADVLEHVPYPKKALAAARELLSPEGVLLVSMPNSENYVWKALSKQGANPYWGELEHYHNFSRTRLYALLRECGFEPRRYAVSERYRVCMEVIAQKA